MLRLKTTTREGKVFLGPFVYDLNEEQAKRKLKKMSWLVSKDEDSEKPIGEAKMEFIEVEEFPREAVYDWRIDIFGIEAELIPLIKIIEEEWEDLECQSQKEH
jgi:hypothetical protein